MISTVYNWICDKQGYNFCKAHWQKTADRCLLNNSFKEGTEYDMKIHLLMCLMQKNVLYLLCIYVSNRSEHTQKKAYLLKEQITNSAVLNYRYFMGFFCSLLGVCCLSYILIYVHRKAKRVFGYSWSALCFRYWNQTDTLVRDEKCENHLTSTMLFIHSTKGDNRCIESVAWYSSSSPIFCLPPEQCSSI